MKRNLRRSVAMNDAKVKMRAVIYGDVQGVGFRAHTKHLAEKLGLSGSVRNLQSGAVEIVAQGQKVTLEKLLEYLQGFFSIDRIVTDYSLPLGEDNGFFITR